MNAAGTGPPGLWLAGDVMTGRGVDQVMRHACDPALFEPWARDARDYVRLAESAHGPVPAPVAPGYVWGEAIEEIERRAPAARVVNLETAITARGRPWAGKDIHYRMHPANVDCLAAAGIDCCVLANNHVLDWGPDGLADTLQALRAAGIDSAGAGPDADAAHAPAALRLPSGGRLLVFACATPDSGVPLEWRAGPRRAGVASLDSLDDASAERVARHVARWRGPNDRVLVSIHWGGNWAPSVPPDQRGFAHRLIELGAADVVHGHSSHHPRPIELYRGRLILYGCGDLLNDYEGIGRERALDPSLVCLYFAWISASDGALERFEIVPMQLRRLQLVRADVTARENLRSLLAGPAAATGVRLRDTADGAWSLER